MSRKTVVMGLGLALSTLAATAAADPMPARETARVLPQKGLAVGLTSPSAIGLGHGLEITTMVVPWLLLSPNASLRAELIKTKSGITFTTEYGLGVPSGAMWILRGYLFPTYATSDKTPPFILQQHAGFWLSGGSRGVWTAHLDVTGRFNSQTDYPPLDSYAPVNLWFAPATADSRWHLGGTYDYALVDWLRGRVGVHGYLVGSSRSELSPFYFSADLALEARLGKRFRLAIGGAWYNFDTGATTVEQNDTGRWQRTHVRSNDFYPTLDFVFYSP